MLIDSRSIPKGKVLEYDISIVGAGTAGIALAWRLADSGLKICLIESGDLIPDKKTQSLYRGENIGNPYFSLETARNRSFGGSTIRWDVPLPDNSLGLRLRPLDEMDFEERDGIPYSGWPFPKRELDAYYDDAQSYCKITPVSYQPEEWADASRTSLVRFDDCLIQTVLFKFGSKSVFLQEHHERIKASENITVFLNANVTDITTDNYGKNVEQLKVECLDGPSFSIRSEYAVLAAGGIETPRILLMSNTVQNCGVGNRNDLVGRFFMEHLHFRSGYIIPEQTEVLNRFPFYTAIQNVNGVSCLGKYAVSEEIMREEKLLNCSFQLLPRILTGKDMPSRQYSGLESKAILSFKALRKGLRQRRLPERTLFHAGTILKGLDKVAAAVFHRYISKTAKMISKKRVPLFQLAHMTEQVPNPESRVTLSHNTDLFGKPRANLNWQWTDFDIESNIRSQEILKRAIVKSGMGDLIIVSGYRQLNPGQIRGGWHHMGTTRMHRDPKQGVVNADSRVHGISNLYIAGPSVFPTGGQANPVLTTIALAFRLADHLSDKLKK